MKKRLVLTALLVLALTLFAFPMTASADPGTYYVRTDGSNDNDGSANDSAHAWKTISYAVATAGDGSTIYVNDGTYTKNVDADKQLTIQSVNGYSSTMVAAVSIWGEGWG